AAEEVESRVHMAIDECMDVRRQFQSGSHSFGSFGGSPAVVMAIFASFVMSIRTFSTPAARTARIARVMSACRNVEGARAMGLPLRSLLIGHCKSSKLSPTGPSTGGRATLDAR